MQLTQYRKTTTVFYYESCYLATYLEGNFIGGNVFFSYIAHLMDKVTLLLIYMSETLDTLSFYV